MYDKSKHISPKSYILFRESIIIEQYNNNIKLLLCWKNIQNNIFYLDQFKRLLWIV